MKGQGLVRKCKKIRILLALVVAGSVVLGAVKAFSADKKGARETNRNAETVDATEPNKPPMIIWFHNGYSDNVAALKTALSSRLISHVMIKCTHRKDFDYRSKNDVLKAIEMVKKSRAKLIWTRSLWAHNNVEDSSVKDLFDPDYYIREIQNLRAEAKEMGTDLVSLDAEPYGNSPMKRYLTHGYRWNSQLREQLKFAVNKAIKAVGKVDVMRPAGDNRRGHPAEILAELGKYRLSGLSRSTDALRRKPPYEVYPYEIFAAYLNTARKDPKAPKYTFFLVPEIFENSHLWSERRGCFFIPGSLTRWR